MKARNSVVVKESQRALEEGCRSNMVTYGGLHMQVMGIESRTKSVPRPRFMLHTAISTGTSIYTWVSGSSRSYQWRGVTAF